MKRVLMLTGDVNLMNVTDAQVPFARIKDTLRRADVLFGNLECCFYEPVDGQSLKHEGFHAPLASAGALVGGGFRAVGTANNVNYGEEAIRSSLRRLASVGIPGTGAGVDRRSARAPAIVTHEGLRFGFLQRTSVYWATGHEATDESAGVAVLTGRTAYEPLLQTRRAGLSFHTGHVGRAHGDWVGMLARLTFDDSELLEVAFSLVRHNERNETYVCDLGQDKEAVEQITRRCDKLGTALAIRDSEMIV